MKTDFVNRRDTKTQREFAERGSLRLCASAVKRMGSWLPDMDLNHDKQIQSLLCYRYTIGQSGVLGKLDSFNSQSSSQTRSDMGGSQFLSVAFSQSRRDYITQPRVARNALPWVDPHQRFSYPEGVSSNQAKLIQRFQRWRIISDPSQGSSLCSQPWAERCNPFGIKKITCSEK